LDSTHQTDEIQTVVATSGRDEARVLTRLIESLHQHECLVSSSTSSVRSRWFETMHDQDTVHLGHAALLYRQRDQALWFDPWLLPWFAESSVPSLWGSLLPKPAAVFLTHDHDDHVDPRTLLHLPKDTPIIVPSRRNRRTLSYDYLSLLGELGFMRVIELAHGESWAFDGGAVYSVPFYGEDPCDLEMPRNCYLIADRGYNVLVHADSGPTNNGRSALKDGVIQSLVQKHGAIPLVFASQQQLLEVRGHAAHAPLSHPGKWLDVGENGYLTNAYLADVCVAAHAKLFVSYATGGAEWYPDHLSFMFSRRNPARTALLTAHWERPEALKELLVTQGCEYHYSHALDLFRRTTDGQVKPLTTGETLTPLSLYRLDHGDPPFIKANSRTAPPR
jgi:Beta-lactamase superfamily domain